MKKYAQIVNNKVHGIFEYKVLPEFDNTIVMIDVTNLTPTPSVGDIYNGNKFVKPITPTLDEQKQQKIKALQAKYQAEYNAYLSKYPKAEVASFPTKQKEALAYQADNNAPTPVIDNIVTGANGAFSKDELVQSILAKVSYLAQQEGVMVAKRDAIKACTTQKELDAIAV